MYEIIDYSAKAIAVVGDTKAIKDDLKAIGGRFIPRLTCGAGWIFSKSKRDQVMAILNGETVTETKSAEPSIFMTKDEKRQLFIDEGNNGDYLDYLCKTYYLGVRLSTGLVVMVKKEPLETSFCFGYGDNGLSTQEDIERAYNNQEYAQTHRNYFRDKNLKGLRGIIAKLNDTENHVYLIKNYYSDTVRRELYFSPYTLDEIQSGEFPSYLTKECKDNMETVSETDKELIIKLYERALSDMTKRVDTYLKKYGLSKIKTWTYLRD